MMIPNEPPEGEYELVGGWRDGRPLRFWSIEPGKWTLDDSSWRTWLSFWEEFGGDHVDIRSLDMEEGQSPAWVLLQRLEAAKLSMYQQVDPGRPQDVTYSFRSNKGAAMIAAKTVVQWLLDQSLPLDQLLPDLEMDFFRRLRPRPGDPGTPTDTGRS